MDLNFSNLTRSSIGSPKLILCSCNSTVWNVRHGGSIAGSFARATGVGVLGAGAGVSFLKNGEPVIRNIYAFGNFTDSEVLSGAGGWKVVNP